MAKQGEECMKKVLESQGYTLRDIGSEDIYGFKERLGIVVEEKDWKDKVIVFKNNIYTIGINGKRYRKNRSQVVKYGYEIKKENLEKGIFRFIVCAYAVSNFGGFRVIPIYFRKFGTIFVVSKEYFPTWLKSLERTYLGEKGVEAPNYYILSEEDLRDKKEIEK